MPMCSAMPCEPTVTRSGSWTRPREIVELREWSRIANDLVTMSGPARRADAADRDGGEDAPLVRIDGDTPAGWPRHRARSTA